MPAGTQSANTFEAFLTQLRESHEVSVYEAIERLVQAGEAVGFDAHDLLGMLDQGMTIEELLELIESKMERLQNGTVVVCPMRLRQRPLHCEVPREFSRMVKIQR